MGDRVYTCVYPVESSLYSSIISCPIASGSVISLYLELPDSTVLVVQQTSGVHPSLLCYCSIQACCHTDI